MFNDYLILFLRRPAPSHMTAVSVQIAWHQCASCYLRRRLFNSSRVYLMLTLAMVRYFVADRCAYIQQVHRRSTEEPNLGDGTPVFCRAGISPSARAIRRTDEVLRVLPGSGHHKRTLPAAATHHAAAEHARRSLVNQRLCERARRRHRRVQPNLRQLNSECGVSRPSSGIGPCENPP